MQETTSDNTSPSPDAELEYGGEADAIGGDYTAEALLARKKASWPEAASEIADLAVRFFRLRDLVYASSRKLAKQEFNLAPAEFEVVVTLRTLPPPHALSATELRRSMLITAGGLTKVIKNLEARGYLVRQHSQADRRSWQLQLTPAGIELAERALPLITDDYARQFGKGLGLPPLSGPG